ncbi:glycosyltransferase family 29 protein [Streptomyces sp. NPDC087903]|uniref:glycosyltransferase family 29 protein n=1 Tax=Streptomyces sp. NPDC087903 TaxID=3365819 RepID=UPI0037F71313
MTRVQNRRARTRGGELDECLRACAVHSGKLVGSLDRRRVELAEQLRKLLVVWGTTTTAAAPAPAGATALLKRAVKGAATPASGIGNDLLDALLAVANKALECGYDDELNLALVISDTVLAERKNSRAGWRLRARLLEALGEEAEALDAYERYLGLTDEDGFGVRARIAGLRAARDKERDLLGLLGRQTPRAEGFARGPATDVWAEGLAALAVGDWTEAEPRLVGALLALAAEDAPVGDRLELLSQYLDLRSDRADGADLPAFTEAVALYAEQRRHRMRGPVPDPTVGGVQWITLGEFRNQIAGKSICLIANSGRVGSSSMGAEIDAYDLVVRFNSYRIEPKHTGSRTDIHATIHKHGFNWDKQVTTRLVFGGISGDWKYSLRNRLVPGAQTYLGDESLRWPVRNIGRLGTDAWSGIPTTGFNMLWLLDFLDVSPTLDLIGFDFYETGAYRVQEAMKLAITSVHEYTSEKAWVMQRAQDVTDMRISLR